jgi:deoxyhypusine synthase
LRGADPACYDLFQHRGSLSITEQQGRRMAHKKSFLSGQRIFPDPIRGGMTVDRLIDETFLAYNGGRLQKACRLFSEKMLQPDVTIGLSLSGALTPAGMGRSCIIPLIKAGFVDWIVSTGANLYHDTHFGIGLELHQGTWQANDVELREEGVVRIYDIFFDYRVLLETDAFFREVIAAPEFQRPMGTAEFHHRVGRYVSERERVLRQGRKSLLSAAYEHGVPIYTSSPGDSSIGMNVAALALTGNRLVLDPNVDVNETAAIVYDTKRRGHRSGVVLLGGGSPKNFVLQTEPQIQEVLGIAERGHDYFLQITDARPDTGGLSGATPGEAVSWGKVDPDKLPDAVVCYADTTIALPILTAYALATRPPLKPKRLYDRRDEILESLAVEYRKVLQKAP